LTIVRVLQKKEAGARGTPASRQEWT
jgi:hypothetical protein